MPALKAPDSPWFVVSWREPDGSAGGYALYERGLKGHRWHLDSTGLPTNESHAGTCAWDPSCRFVPLDQSGADACFAVAALNSAAWPAYAAHLFEECEHG